MGCCPGFCISDSVIVSVVVVAFMLYWEFSFWLSLCGKLLVREMNFIMVHSLFSFRCEWMWVRSCDVISVCGYFMFYRVAWEEIDGCVCFGISRFRS